VSLVLDGSAALAWCFEDETSPAIDAMMLRVARDGAAVPNLWRLEVANGLQSGVRRGRLSAARRDEMLAVLAEMDITADLETDRYAWSSAVRLAEEHRLTVYDACYLELAMRRRLPLATLDAALVGAAKQANVTVVL